MHRKRELPSDANHTGRTFDAAEVDNLRKVIDSGTLNATKGTWVNAFQERFAKMHGVPFARCVSSGTAAVHAAVAAINPEPGDEIITTPITDMGAITPILYQTALPVFADIDPETYNVTADTIAPRITERTRAIIVTHLFGNPCEMGPILNLAKKHRIPVIEDAAQAFLAEYRGKLVGTLGAIGCFSLQQGKHITSGEGGIVLSCDPVLSRRASLFADKAWGYGDPDPDHYFLALNYRMTELQGAVAMAQIDKLEGSVSSRRRNAALLTEMLTGLNGVSPPKSTPDSLPVFWKYCLRIDPEQIPGGVDALSRRLKEEWDIFSLPRYIKKPAFMCQVFQEQNTFGSSGFPFKGPHRSGLPPVSYRKEDYPGTLKALERILVLPWNERYQEEDVAYIGNAIMNTVQAMAS